MKVLAELMREKIAADGISEREASRQIGVSPTTVSRTLSGETIDVDTLIRICDWLGVNPSHILDAQLPGDASLSAAIAAILEVKPALAAVFADAIADVLEGEVPASVIRDIAAYAAYRLNLEMSDLKEAED